MYIPSKNKVQVLIHCVLEIYFIFSAKLFAGANAT